MAETGMPPTEATENAPDLVSSDPSGGEPTCIDDGADTA